MTTEAMTKLLSGDLVHAILTIMTGLFGYWFYFIMYLIPAMMSYIKTQDVVFPLMLALIFGSVGFVALPPEADAISFVLCALGIAGLLYRVYKGGY